MFGHSIQSSDTYGLPAIAHHYWDVTFVSSLCNYLHLHVYQIFGTVIVVTGLSSYPFDRFV